MNRPGERDDPALAAHIGALRVVYFESIASTMDEAHRLAESGAESGTLVLADEQLAGRGRLGRRWTSGRGAGIWATSIHRGVPVSALDVLSIRIGLALAPALDPFAPGPVSLKWPNDLLVRRQKLGGILVEARWRDVTVEWVAVGIGINLQAPQGRDDAVALAGGTARRDVLHAIFPVVVAACLTGGELSSDELASYAGRDSARDVRLVEPAAGLARGITPNGALVVETAQGRELFRRGSLVRAPEVE